MIDPEVKQLIRKMIAKEPDDRPTMEQVKERLEELMRDRHQ